MQIVRQDEQLLAAAYGGKLTEFQRLVEQEEVGINSKNDFGVGALHMAIMSGSLHVAAYMLSKSANVNAQDDQGQTALHQACIDGDSEAFGLLTAHNADISARTRAGKTPLHLACWFDHKELVSFLLEAGADIHCVDNDGKAVLDDEEIDPQIKQLISDAVAAAPQALVVSSVQKKVSTSSMGCSATFEVSTANESELVRAVQGGAAEGECAVKQAAGVPEWSNYSARTGGVTIVNAQSVSGGVTSQSVSGGVTSQAVSGGVTSQAVSGGVTQSSTARTSTSVNVSGGVSAAPSKPSNRSSGEVTFSSSAATRISSHSKSTSGISAAAAGASNDNATPSTKPADNPLLMPLDPELDCTRPWEQKSAAPVAISDSALDRMMAQMDSNMFR